MDIKRTIIRMDVYGPYPSHLENESYAVEQVTILSDIKKPMTLMTQIDSSDKYRIIFYMRDWVQVEIFTQLYLNEVYLQPIIGWVQKTDLSATKEKLDQLDVKKDKITATTLGFIKLAKSYLNTPYRWGGKTRSGTDCSGLVCQIYSAYGVHLPRFADGQHKVCKAISPQKLAVGDLIFSLHNDKPVHVMIYLGNEEIIESCGLIDVYTTRIITFEQKFNIQRKLMTYDHLVGQSRVRFGRPLI